MRSIERGLYFMLTDNFRIALDMSLILALMTVLSGAKYCLLMSGTFFVYIWWTIYTSKQLLPLFQKQTDL